MTASHGDHSSENERVASADVDTMFTRRWSPRSFLDRTLEEGIVHRLFEAARWAPSASNLQPAMFVYEDRKHELERVRPILLEFNRRWAQHAPLLIFAFARTKDPRNGERNAFAEFDTGAAWMSIALQAGRMGLSAHAMGGIDRDLAHGLLKVPRDEFQAVCAIAVGKAGAAERLPPDLQLREKPSGRRDPSEMAFRGHYAQPTEQ